MRRLPLLLCLAALSLTAAGEPETPPLEGVVLDPDGRPLAGATVTLKSPNSCCRIVPGHTFRAVTTDAEGRYRLERPEQPMEVQAEHPDYASTWQSTTEGGVLRLRAPCHLEGEVPADAGGEVDVFVTQGLRRLAGVSTAGAFRLGPLPPGETVTLHVASPRHRPFQRVLVAGDANVRVDLDPGLALRGRVLPARQGVVLRASQGEARESVATTDGDGAFRLTGLRAGPVCVVVLDEETTRVLRATAGGHLEVRLDR